MTNEKKPDGNESNELTESRKSSMMNLTMAIARSAFVLGAIKYVPLWTMITSMDGSVESYVSTVTGLVLVALGITILFNELLTILEDRSNT